jgi:hypothetical protein
LSSNLGYGIKCDDIGEHVGKHIGTNLGHDENKLGSWCEQIEKKEVLSFGSSMSLGLMMRNFFLSVSNIFMSPLWIHWSLLILVIIVVLYFFNIHTSSIFTQFLFFPILWCCSSGDSSLSIFSKKWQYSKYVSEHS